MEHLVSNEEPLAAAAAANKKATIMAGLVLAQKIINGLTASQERCKKDIDYERRNHINELDGYGKTIQDSIDALGEL